MKDSKLRVLKHISGEPYINYKIFKNLPYDRLQKNVKYHDCTRKMQVHYN